MIVHTWKCAQSSRPGRTAGCMEEDIQRQRPASAARYAPAAIYATAQQPHGSATTARQRDNRKKTTTTACTTTHGDSSTYHKSKSRSNQDIAHLTERTESILEIARGHVRLQTADKQALSRHRVVCCWWRLCNVRLAVCSVDAGGEKRRRRVKGENS